MVRIVMNYEYIIIVLSYQNNSHRFTSILYEIYNWKCNDIIIIPTKITLILILIVCIQEFFIEKQYFD